MHSDHRTVHQTGHHHVDTPVHYIQHMTTCGTTPSRLIANIRRTSVKHSSYILSYIQACLYLTSLTGESRYLLNHAAASSPSSAATPVHSHTFTTLQHTHRAVSSEQYRVVNHWGWHCGVLDFGHCMQEPVTSAKCLQGCSVQHTPTPIARHGLTNA
jgi:hypothetical protein